MSDAKKIRDYKKSRQPKPPISKAAHRANCEDIVDNLLMPIIEKMRKSPSDIQPVAESLDDLMAQLNSGGIHRQPFIMQAGGRRLVVCDDLVTELEYQPTIDSGGGSSGVPTSDTLSNVGGAENSGANEPTFTDEQIAILETLK